MQARNLSDFYEVCKGLELARNFQFPVLREVSSYQNLFVTFEFVIAGTLFIVTDITVSLFSQASTIFSYNYGGVYERRASNGGRHIWATGMTIFSYYIYGPTEAMVFFCKRIF